MTRATDKAYLVGEQYATDENLQARVELHRRFSTATEPWQRWIFDRLVVPDDADVLEVGCGLGELWAENADRLPARWRPTLTDLSPGMVERTRSRLGERASYGVADAAELPFAAESFDLVIATTPTSPSSRCSRSFARRGSRRIWASFASGSSGRSRCTGTSISPATRASSVAASSNIDKFVLRSPAWTS